MEQTQVKEQMAEAMSEQPKEYLKVITQPFSDFDAKSHAMLVGETLEVNPVQACDIPTN